MLEGVHRHRIQLAQALADHLGYRINLGAVVSQYIGRTEESLEVLFGEANHAGSILFFDEADSLFSSRTQVKDAHGRYDGLFSRLFSFQGIIALGVEWRHSVPPHLLPRCTIISVRNYWPRR